MIRAYALGPRLSIGTGPTQPTVSSRNKIASSQDRSPSCSMTTVAKITQMTKVLIYLIHAQFAKFFGVFSLLILFVITLGVTTHLLVVPPTINAQTTTCVTAGCSGQLCISAEQAQNGLSTTCVFKEEYACYQQANCVLLSSGTCGWQPTQELTQCLAEARGESTDPDDFTIDPVTGLCKTADLTGDGKVDIRDYSVLVSQFMDTGPHTTLPADLNCDGKVDLIDYSLLIRNLNL